MKSLYCLWFIWISFVSIRQEYGKLVKFRRSKKNYIIAFVNILFYNFTQSLISNLSGNSWFSIHVKLFYTPSFDACEIYMYRTASVCFIAPIWITLKFTLKNRYIFVRLGSRQTSRTTWLKMNNVSHEIFSILWKWEIESFYKILGLLI